MNEASGAFAGAGTAGAAHSFVALNAGDRLFLEKARADLVACVGRIGRRLRGPVLGAEDVHRARRLLKRANALALLLSDAIGPRADRAAEDLRRFRRELGAARDLDVIGQTLDSLAPDVAVEEAAKIREALQARRIDAAATAQAPDLVALRRELRWLAGEAARWSLAHGRAEHLVAALTRSYKRARRRGVEGFASQAPVDLHDLRKALIVHREQLQALEDIWPKLVRAWCAEAQALRDALGRVNDLVLLADFAASSVPGAVEALRPAIEEASERAMKHAAPAFERLFFERPSEAASRLTAWLAHPKRRPEIEAPQDEADSDADADAA